MNTVVIDGTSYTKASVLAKKYRYTTDYLGQLCRRKKVDAQLVGRSWYISETSLETVTLKRAEAIRRDEILLKSNNFSTKVSESHSIAVPAPLSKNTKKMLSTYDRRIAPCHQGETRYELDSGELLPMAKQIKPQLPKFVPLNAEINEQGVHVLDTDTLSEKPAAISVKVLEKPKNILVFTPPPAISLVGEIPVKQIESMTTSARPPQLPDAPSTLDTPSLVKKRKDVSISFTPVTVAIDLQPETSTVYIKVAVMVTIVSLCLVLFFTLFDVAVHYGVDGTVDSFSFSQSALLHRFK